MLWGTPKSEKDPWDDSHRPWALPNLPWTMKQIWSNLLFAHYPIKFEVLRKLVPEALHLDSYNGMCWIGVVPFRMSGIRLRGLPSIPGTDQFPELNVRTYVTLDGKPGVYFLVWMLLIGLLLKGLKHYITYHIGTLIWRSKIVEQTLNLKVRDYKTMKLN